MDAGRNDDKILVERSRKIFQNIRIEDSTRSVDACCVGQNVERGGRLGTEKLFYHRGCALSFPLLADNVLNNLYHGF